MADRYGAKGIELKRLKSCKVFCSLSLRHQKFVLEYLKDFNGTRAAERANFSKKRARITASELVAKRNIQEALAEVAALIFHEDIAIADNVLKELALIAFSDMANYVTIGPEGEVTLKPFDAMPEGASRVVSAVEETRRILGVGTGEGKEMVLEIRTKYRMHDKVRALDLLGKRLGMWTYDKTAPPAVINVMFVTKGEFEPG